jgi:hypothetical protein
MAANGGFIQYGARPRATDLLPMQAVDWLLACRNAAALGWVFLGRWLFLERADDARILADRARLATLVVDDTFRALSCAMAGHLRRGRRSLQHPLRLLRIVGDDPELHEVVDDARQMDRSYEDTLTECRRSGLTDHRNLSPGVCRIRD